MSAVQCPSCSDTVLETQFFCPRCGTSLDAPETPTGTAPRPVRTPGAAERTPARGSASRQVPPAGRVVSGGRPGSGASSVGRVVASKPSDERFSAGDLLLDRYRVIGLLGRGGMGEVYRADDLKLGQPVALKFLPASLQGDEEWRERFLNEARMAREVSHAAVCRVHDVGEVDGQHFLSMEFVDGEDLASLIRRIGRLPGDKAVDIARQLCAGLAAAHAKGVLHRDLKPQNVMLDGKGRVRITDFGLAGLAETIQGDDVGSGTPAYMSPEQLAGRDVTRRSDVFALGLVLYEVFTGRRAYPGRSLAEIRKQHEQSVAPPSGLVGDIAPEAEAAILRCLEPDPSRRPDSALMVSAMLPGGDPLAAALAAGETPSPEMVAAAGRSEGMRPVQAWACVGLIVACVGSLLPFARQRELMHRVPEVKPPAVLEYQAGEILRKLGAVEAPADHAVAYGVDGEFLRWAQEQDKSPHRWDRLATGEPAVLSFWYRRSPRALVPFDDSGEIHWSDPPLTVSGMAGVRVDLGGRLLSFYRVPPQVDDPGTTGSTPDWSALFAEARLDPARFKAVEPRWTPPFFCDTRGAWEGTYPQRPEIPLRVEGAAYRGRPVAFFLVAPWTRPERMQPFKPTAGQAAAQIVFVVLLVMLMVAGALLARHHLRAGRGDRRGAFRLATVVSALGMGVWGLQAHHVADRSGELALVARGAGGVLLFAFVLWLFYLALEPYVRRLWPHTIISWTRLLSGRIQDPLVGRDTLVGAAWGAAVPVVFAISDLVQVGLGYGAPSPQIRYMDSLLGTTRVLATILGFPAHAISLAVSALLILLLLKLLLRREQLAALAMVAVLTLVQALGQSVNSETPLWLNVGKALLVMSSFAFLLLRFGLLSAVVGVTFVNSVFAFPMTTDLSSWSSGPTIVALLVAAALVGFAFRASQSPSRMTGETP